MQRDPRSLSPLAFLRQIARPLDLLLLASPIAFMAERQHYNSTLIFFASALAIIPLARLIGVATESLAGRVGAAAGGLLNATFGNATELIIAVVALRAGQSELVKASLIGSILGNILPVMGFSFLFGGLNRERQEFDRTAAGAAGAQLALAAGALLIPTLLVTTTHVRHSAFQGLSVMTSIILLIAYGAGLVFSLRTHAHLYTQEDEEALHSLSFSVSAAVAILVVATVAVAVLSNWLVDGVEGVTSGLGWTQVFIGVVIVATVGNAAEHASAVTVARRDKMNLSLSIALGSAAQISLFVAPALVLVSIPLGHPMTLLFQPFEVAAVVIAASVINLMIADGESTWLEGVQLLAVYAVLVTAFFVHI